MISEILAPDPDEEEGVKDFDVSGVEVKKDEVFGKPEGAEGKGASPADDSAASDDSDAPYVIELPSGVDAKLLGNIKELLTKHKGERNVVLHIPSQKSLKRIKVPFGVSIDKKFEEKLSSLIETSS